MCSSENANWFIDCDLIDEITARSEEFASNDPGFVWPSRELTTPSDSCVDINCCKDDGLRNAASKKRIRSDSCGGPSSKACREKMRRDRLNDRFLELASVMDPGKPPKLDKVSILSDAASMVNMLRSEAEKLKVSNQGLEEKIKELKTEKNELRDEKQKLKTEKEKLEHQLKVMTFHSGFPSPIPIIPATLTSQGQPTGNKLMPFVSYPGVSMWQFMPPASLDTSQDHVLRPPVA